MSTDKRQEKQEKQEKQENHIKSGHSFLPTNKKEMQSRGWEQPDFVLVTGDAYVDHPSFGAAVISRLLESRGYKVAILSQPAWKDKNSFKIFGAPRLGFLVTSGNIDSMVNHYTAAKRKRSEDLYSPGGKSGMRPDRAAMVYARTLRELYSDVPIILGGIESSLRRLAHFDYWDNKVRRSLLLDAQADFLIYGMGERQVIELADALDRGLSVKEITHIRGTVYKTKEVDHLKNPLVLPDYDQILGSKKRYAESFMMQYDNTDAMTATTLVEPYRDHYVVQNAPQPPLQQNELDQIYSLPYERQYHPKYEKEGGIPAIAEVQYSLISSRGCFGSCNFCALTFHQGRVVQSRSHDSIVTEAKKLIHEPDFKGYIHDVGGPTANFRKPACQKQLTHGACRHKQCLFPEPCDELEVDHRDYEKLLSKLKDIPEIKKVFIRSGIRYDYLMEDKDQKFLETLCRDHVSGQLKVAPEHISAHVLRMMGKPEKEVFEKFVKSYFAISKKLGREQYIVPYLMSGHPGSGLDEAIELAEYLRDTGYQPEQVQDFYPTPGTLSTTMYYTELDPRTMDKIYVPKQPKDKAMQRALMQYKKPQNYDLVQEALIKAGRKELIGTDKKSLIRPRKNYPAIKKEKSGEKDKQAKKPQGKARQKQKKRR